jgi:hypothetical protein
MRPRVWQLVAAGVLALCAAGMSAPAFAQSGPGSAPEAAAPDAQARGGGAPSPRASPQPGSEGGARAVPDEADVQHGCPDRRRPLQLIV